MSSAGDETTAEATGFDRGAAVTRSLLGYGVIAGPVYLVVGVVQAVVRDGFDLSRHSLSLLANGPWGWVQIANFVVVGLMVLLAAWGYLRALEPTRSVGVLVGVYGVGLGLAGVFVADPMEGFPPGTPDGAPESVSLAGIVHLAAGGIGFVALAAAFWMVARWFARRGDAGLATGARVAAAVVAAGFLVGAAAGTTPVGVPALWVAVLAGWFYLTVASVAVYRTVPHPDLHRRD